jgi:hypothetical protein
MPRLISAPEEALILELSTGEESLFPSASADTSELPPQALSASRMIREAIVVNNNLYFICLLLYGLETLFWNRSFEWDSSFI